MNVFDKLQAYVRERNIEKPENEKYLEIEETGKNSKGVYTNEYLSQSYREMCSSAVDYYGDAFEEDPDAEWNVE